MPIDEASQRLADVRARIARAARIAGREADAVTLIAISKTHDADAIRPLIRAGQRVFGENRVQEAEGKWPALREAAPDVALHLVGQLQSNKAEDAVALLDEARAADLPVQGLMCVPPLDLEPAPYFALLASIARDHGLGGLSMGMSGDFETAVTIGATHVRVGTALFGARA